MNFDPLQALESRVKLLEADLLEARARVASPYMTRNQAAAFLQVSLSSINKALAAGTLPKYMFAGAVRILRSDLVAAVKLVTGPDPREIEACLNSRKRRSPIRLDDGKDATKE